MAPQSSLPQPESSEAPEAAAAADDTFEWLDLLPQPLSSPQESQSSEDDFLAPCCLGFELAALDFCPAAGLLPGRCCCADSRDDAGAVGFDFSAAEANGERDFFKQIFTQS